MKNNIFTVKEEDRCRSLFPAAIACLGAVYIAIDLFYSFYNMTTYGGNDSILATINSLCILFFHIGAVMLAASLLLRGEPFVKLRTASLVTQTASASAVFVTSIILWPSNSSVVDTFFRNALTYGAAAAAGMLMLLATYDRKRAAGPLIAIGSIVICFIIFISSHSSRWTSDIGFFGILYKTSYYYSSKSEFFSFLWIAYALVLAGVAIPMFKYFTRPDPKPEPKPQPQVVLTYAQQGQPAVYYQNGQPVFTKPQYYEPGRSVMYKPLDPQAYIINGSPVRTPAQQIAELNDLRARGLITEQEYQNKRVEILDEL